MRQSRSRPTEAGGGRRRRPAPPSPRHRLPAPAVRAALGGSAPAGLSDVVTLQRTLGNRAVSRLVQGSDLQVQRLMAPDAFRRRTTLFGESLFGRDRQKVTAIDTALGAYHAVTPVSGANIATKKARLDDVVARCDTYLADVSGSAKRKEGVRELRQEAQREDTVIAHLAASEVAATAVDRFERLTEAQNDQVRRQQDSHITRDIVPMDP